MLEAGAGPYRHDVIINKDGSAQFKVSQDVWAIIDADEVNRVCSMKWRIWDGYIIRKGLSLHRCVLGAKAGQIVDHINRVRHDCRKSNLRICTYSDNRLNSSLRSDNRSGVAGVYFCTTNKKWVAQFRYDGKRKSLGSYRSFEEAVAARRAEERKYLPRGAVK